MDLPRLSQKIKPYIMQFCLMEKLNREDVYLPEKSRAGGEVNLGGLALARILSSLPGRMILNTSRDEVNPRKLLG